MGPGLARLEGPKFSFLMLVLSSIDKPVLHLRVTKSFAGDIDDRLEPVEISF